MCMFYEVGNRDRPRLSTPSRLTAKSSSVSLLSTFTYYNRHFIYFQTHNTSEKFEDLLHFPRFVIFPVSASKHHNRPAIYIYCNLVNIRSFSTHYPNSKMASQFFTQSAFTPVEEAQPKSEGTGIQFCPECSNMMIPKAPEQRNDPLLYVCGHCGRKEPAGSARVYVNILKHDASSSKSTGQALSNDPALRRLTTVCPGCETERVVVVLMAPKVNGQDQLRQMFECTLCHRQWMDNEGL